jgi:hypothetical protein
MEWWHVYLFTRLDGVVNVATMTAVFSGIAVLGAGIGSMMFAQEYMKDEKEACNKVLKWSVPAAIAAVVVILAVPSQKEAAAIYLLPKLANSDFAKEAGQIPTDAAKLMRLKLEAWIADMEPTPKK